MEQKLSARVEALAVEAEFCADYYIDKPGHFGPETAVDLYRTIARLAREISALQEKDL